jgi:hypothetical protein
VIDAATQQFIKDMPGLVSDSTSTFDLLLTAYLRGRAENQPKPIREPKFKVINGNKQ